jgi:hypothetical protein
MKLVPMCIMFVAILAVGKHTFAEEKFYHRQIFFEAL